MSTASGGMDGSGKESKRVLICFAVKEEGPCFRAVWASPRPKRPSQFSQLDGLVTGMGRRNALECVRPELEADEPRLVLTCGFAGGLNPALTVGTVIFDTDPDLAWTEKLEALGARRARFHCTRRVAATAVEKRDLWRSTGADAVEMESSVIRTLCRERGIPSATIRVISDHAEEDLPLDFNVLMTAHERISYWRLAWQLLKSPHKVPALMRLQRQTSMAARRLNAVLEALLPDILRGG